MKIKFVVLSVLMFVLGMNTIQAKVLNGKVIYQVYSYGKLDTDAGKVVMKSSADISEIQTDLSGKDLISEVPVEATYLDFKQNKYCHTALFNSGRLISTEGKLNSLEGFHPEGKPEKILGYECQKYVGTSFSNKIELWVTKAVGFVGTPIVSFPFSGGLILKYCRNGNYSLVAEHVFVTKEKQPLVSWPDDLGQKMNGVAFRQALAGAYMKKVSVFKNQQINWGDTINNPKDTELNYTYRYAGGTVIVKQVNLPKVPDGTILYASLKEQSAGDAYDRTGSVFVIPVNKQKSFLDGLRKGVNALPSFKAANGKTYQGTVLTKNYEPVIELMRFFTPFGIHAYNTKRDVGIQWRDTAYYKEEISDLLPVLQGKTWIGVFIGNYDKGGHRISLDLTYHLTSKEQIPVNKQKKYWIQPLFTTTNIMEMAGQEYGTMFKNDSLSVTFSVPEGVKNIQLRYLSTGHGGWGNGDEYLKKPNHILLDGKLFYSYTPWRTDCGTYRAYNPASGNSWDGETSSDGSRSGWCPGSVTNPVYVPVDSLAAGQHQIKVAIPIGSPEGNLFSAWNISAVLIGEY